ncbi:MAG: hypothetical protein A3B78_02350 [Omnitrophica WOR_2 bacterium RIFCSPHIGHO2_02_FULL_67_20]|nr:MAG: hypothetical protein A3B78_02350 [Omnitrophica WOR_2 bacterium RIFCSPHIGHO2_02_FULL_67_20]
MAAPLAVIAGSGRFPFHVARGAKRRGLTVVALGIQGWADPALAQEVEQFEPVEVGQLGRLIERLKAHGVAQAVMAGKVTKEVLLEGRTAFDPQMQRLLSGLRDFSVGALLGAIGARLAAEGITVLDSSTFVTDDLCPAGVLTARRPSPAEEADMALGLRVARTLTAFDVGQTVVVKGQVVVAVEALEGTDAAIRRAHALAGSGLVAVKTASPDHDRRFDLPVVGLDTLAVLREAGVSCLAVEAGAALILDRAAFLEAASAAGICVVGASLPSG